jgi:squalene cyclase
MGVDGSISFEGWLSSQLCVTAVAIEALTDSGCSEGIAEALDLIRRHQSTEGYWNSYWWSGQLYATVHCMAALLASMTLDDAESLAKAWKWIATMQLRDGSWYGSPDSGAVPFWTALALSGLLLNPQTDREDNIERGIDWLLAHQLADGSWASGYILRITHPAMIEPWKYPLWNQGGRAINAVITDHRRLFSTATVLNALSEYRNRLP